MSNGLCLEISYFLPRLSYTWAKEEMSLPHPWLGLVYFAFCVPTPPSRAQPGKHGVVDIATLVGLEMNLGEKQPQELHYSGL